MARRGTAGNPFTTQHTETEMTTISITKQTGPGRYTLLGTGPGINATEKLRCADLRRAMRAAVQMYHDHEQRGRRFTRVSVFHGSEHVAALMFS